MGTLLNRRRYMGGGSALPYDAEAEYIGFQHNCSIDTGSFTLAPDKIGVGKSLVINMLCGYSVERRAA